MKSGAWALLVGCVAAVAIVAAGTRGRSHPLSRGPIDINEGASITAEDISRLESQYIHQPPSTPSSPRTNWRVYEGASEMDDAPIVRLYADPMIRVLDRYGRTRDVRLFVRCQDNTTALVLRVDDYTGIRDIQVEIRLDDSPSFVRQFGVSTDRENIGLWSGAQSIPVVRQMATASRIRFRYTLPGESPEVVPFNLEGFGSRVRRVAEVCHWTL